MKKKKKRFLGKSCLATFTTKVFLKNVIQRVTVCSCYVTYAFQSESTLYSRLNVKERLARSRLEIWSLSECNWTWTQNHLVRKWTLNHLAKLANLTKVWPNGWVFVNELSGSGFESSCSPLYSYRTSEL